VSNSYAKIVIQSSLYTNRQLSRRFSLLFINVASTTSAQSNIPSSEFGGMTTAVVEAMSQSFKDCNDLGLLRYCKAQKYCITPTGQVTMFRVEVLAQGIWWRRALHLVRPILLFCSVMGMLVLLIL
jgi:hypothetical protein